MAADYTMTFDMTILSSNGKPVNRTWRFTGVQTILWQFGWDKSGRPYLQECNGNLVRGEEVGHEVVANEVAERLAGRGIEKTDEEIAAMAKDAVAHYLDDAVRAECWNNAIGFIVENS